MTQGFANNTRSAFGLKLPWAKDCGKSKISDKTIREEVIEALRHCPSLAGNKIEVRIDRGAVHLTGSVASLDNRRLAADAAWTVIGVEDVINSLQTENY